MNDGEMLNVLYRVEADLPRLLLDKQPWNSLDVDYHPPRVERLWRQYDAQHRVFLHRIYPCGPGEALFHPHPWPSAIRVLDGRYEMGIAHSDLGNRDPEHYKRVVSTTILAPKSAYEMIHSHGWHYVRPLDAPSVSVMVTGPPWEHTLEIDEKPSKPLRPLKPQKIALLLAVIRSYYPDNADEP